MPIPSTDINFLEVAVAGLIASGGSNAVKTINVFHFRRTATVAPVDKGHIDTAFQAAIVVPMAAAMNARWTQQHNALRFIDDATDAPLDIPHTVPGGVAGDSLSPELAVFLLMKTGLRGKSYRGSKHIGPLSEADNTTPNEDILNAAAIARFATLVTAIQGGMTDSDGNVWKPCILSRKISQLTTNPTVVFANDVVSINLNKRIGRLLRREPASVY